MCGCGKPRVVWDPKQMEVGREYPRVVNGREYIGVKLPDGKIDIYEVAARAAPAGGPTHG